MNKKVLIAGGIASFLFIAAIIAIVTREQASNQEFTKVQGAPSLPYVSKTIEAEKLKIPSLDDGHSLTYLNDYYGQAIVMSDKAVLSQLPQYDNGIATIIRQHNYPMTLVHYISRYQAQKCEFKESFQAIVAIAKNPQNENQKNMINMLNDKEKNNIREYVKRCLS